MGKKIEWSKKKRIAEIGLVLHGTRGWFWFVEVLDAEQDDKFTQNQPKLVIISIFGIVSTV